MSFETLGLMPRLAARLTELGMTKPTPIQARAIPEALKGRDILGLAQTGTGKTAAFGLPLLNALIGKERAEPKTVHALVLAPTRELAMQIHAVLMDLAAGANRPRIGLVVGGRSLGPQADMLFRGTEILVATPGRLIDLIDRKAVRLNTARFLVLDEADQMLDLGFIHALRRIAALLPKARQTMLFSATMPKLMAELAGAYLTDPVRIEVAPPGKAADKVAQAVHFVSAGDKQALLISWFDPRSGAPAAQAANPSAELISPVTVALIAAGFLLLHWVTRAPARINLLTVDGDRPGLIRACDRLTVVSIQELWVALPLLAWLQTQVPEVHLFDRLPPYLLMSAICGLLMKWTLQGQPPARQGWAARMTGSLCRAVTMALILSLPLLLGSPFFLQMSHLPLAAPFILIGLGLVRGQPWRSQKKANDFAVQVQPADITPPVRRRRRWTLRSVLAAVAAAAALVVAVGSGVSSDWSHAAPKPYDPSGALKSSLTESFGHRARYVRAPEGSLLLGQALSSMERAQAEEMVRRQLPGQQLSFVEVHPWRWEVAGMGFILLTLSGVLVAIPAVLLGIVSVSRPSYVTFFAALAGANGAFAMGAKWGWFWLEPGTHLAAFVLCTIMGGAGLGWMRQRIVARRLAAEIAPPGQGAEHEAPSSMADLKPGTTALPTLSPAPPQSDAGLTRKLMKVNVLTVELGRSLTRLIDPAHGAKLMERVKAIRKHVAMELGVVLPEGVCLRENLLLKPDSYTISVREIPVAQGTLEMERLIAIGPEDKIKQLLGTHTLDPIYGMPGVWIGQESKGDAERYGCMIFDPVSIVAVHLTAVCRSHARELITVEYVAQSLQSLAEDCPATVAFVREKHSLLTIRDVYRGLAGERVSIRDQETILNVLAGSDGCTESMVEECRFELRAAICNEHTNNEGTINVITLDPDIERTIQVSIQRTDRGSLLTFDEKVGVEILQAISQQLEALAEKGLQPILLTSPLVRPALRKLTEVCFPNLVVLSWNEIAPKVNVHSVAMVV